MNPGQLPKPLPVLLALALTACGSSGGSSSPSGNANPASNTVTVTVIRAANGAPLSGATVQLIQNNASVATTDNAGQARFNQNNGLQPGPYTLVVTQANSIPLSISDLQTQNPTIQVQDATTAPATPLTVKSTGLPAPLPAMSPGAPAVASVESLTTASRTQAGIDSGAQPGGGSELSAIGQPGTPLSIRNVRGIAEALSSTVVDLSVPGPGGRGHPIYFAIASFPNGLASAISEVTLNFQEVSGSIRSVEGSIQCSADFDLATDTISLRPVAFLDRCGLVKVGGIHSGNTITGAGQRADFGFSGPQLDFLFMYDSPFRGDYAYECTVSKSNASVTQYIRDSFSNLPAPASFKLRPAIDSVTVDTSMNPLTPIIRWTHMDAPGRGGIYQVTLRSNGSSQTHYLPGDATELEVPARLALSSGASYSVEVSAIFMPSPDLSAVSPNAIAQSATDIARRDIQVTIP